MTPTPGFPTFEEAFLAAHDSEPYEWQRRLAADLEANAWPTEISVPTGMGKTTSIFACVYELARQSHDGGHRTAPMRIFHVVDRRSIIDDVAVYARSLAERINNAVPGDALAPVRSALATLLGPGDDFPVVVSGIHGDSPDDRAWLRSTGCAIVSLTSHQFVSRLLFRGIGLGANTRPIAAGLCGVDRVVLFDEPHMSEQSVHTIRAAEQLQVRAPEHPRLPSARTVLLGATVPRSLADNCRQTLGLDADRETSPHARQRLGARRDVTVHWVPPKDTAYVDAMVDAVKDAWEGGSQRTVVFVNTVDMAQKVYAKLERKSRTPVVLVTSRFRPIDRQGPEGEQRRLSATPLTVVSTQALEVGVNYTFDALVTEMAPWPTLIQRLGRLNRDGASQVGHGTLVGSWDPENEAVQCRPASATVYGEQAVVNTASFVRSIDPDRGATVDLSYAGIAALAQSRELDDLSPAPARIATLHSGLLPLLTQTRPTPTPDLPWNALISGPDTDNAVDIEVAWRSNLSVFDDAPVPPLLDRAEFVSVPRAAVESFLQGTKLDATVSDVGANKLVTTAANGKNRVMSWRDIRVWDSVSERWRIPQDWREAARAPRLILHPSLGGYSEHLGWTGQRDGSPVRDKSLLAALLRMDAAEEPSESQARSARVDLVVSPETLRMASRTLEAAADEENAELARQLAAEADDLESLTRDAEDLEAVPDLLADFVGEFVERVISDGSTGWSVSVDVVNEELVAVAHLTGVPKSAPARRTRVLLKDHSAQVGSWAATDAEHAGLDRSLTTALGIAGQWHDAGKARGEWQWAMGNHESEPVAKSLPGASRSQATMLEPGWRHELLSVNMMGPGTCPLERHLVGSHHGWFRPVVQPLTAGPGRDPSAYPGPVAHSDEFARLNQRFGPWGLAYLEAVLRLADWRASSKPEEGVAAFDREPPADADRKVAPTDFHVRDHDFPGLSTHVMTGWFASVGLLAAAQDLGDTKATLRWRTMSNAAEAPPVIPVLRSAISIRELVEYICTNDEWATAEKLAHVHGFPGGIGVKYQKWSPASEVRSLLLAAEGVDNHLLMSLASDLQSAESGKKDQPAGLPMPITQVANNASYPDVALKRTAALSKDINEAVKIAVDTLTSVDAGYDYAQCDGGMDRTVVDPGINGLGVDKARLIRAGIAPLVLFGGSRVGVGLPEGVGVTKDRIVLPLPLDAATYAQVQSLSHIGLGNPNWDWTLGGMDWVYEARRHKGTQYETVWRGAPVKRSELNQKRQI